MATVNITIKAVKEGNKNAKLEDAFAMFAGAGLQEKYKQIDLKKGRFKAEAGLKHSLFYGVFAKGGTSYRVKVMAGAKELLNFKLSVAQGSEHSAGHRYFTP